MSEPVPTHSEPDTGHNDPAAVVREFLRALGDLDVDRVLTLVAPEILYHNKGLPPARGLAAFERQMRGLARYATGFEAHIHNLAAEGPIVLTERTDVIEIHRFRSEFWVCGTFEVRDGRIVVWRDYFDFVNLSLASARGMARAVFGKRSASAR